MARYKFVEGKLIALLHEVTSEAESVDPVAVAEVKSVVNRPVIKRVVRTFLHAFVGSLFIALPTITRWSELKSVAASAFIAAAAAAVSLAHGIIETSIKEHGNA